MGLAVYDWRILLLANRTYILRITQMLLLLLDVLLLLLLIVIPGVADVYFVVIRPPILGCIAVSSTSHPR